MRFSQDGGVMPGVEPDGQIRSALLPGEDS